MRPNITVNKLNGTLGRRGSNTDAVFGLVISAPAAVGAGAAVNGVVYPLKSQRDAVALGLTAQYDDTNKVLVYHHIDRFFKRNPNGFLYLMTAPQTQSLADMADLSKDYAKKLLRSMGGKVKYLGIARNPLAAYEPVLETGLDADVLSAVTKAQALYAEEFSQFRYASVLIEGRSFNGTAAAAMDLRTLASPQVSITIAADPAISGAKPEYQDYAAIGDVLGLISLAAVSQDPGEMDPKFNLSDPGRDMFVTAGLSSGLAIDNYDDQSLNLLNEKGYIFPTAVAGYDGFYLSDSHTCSALENNDYAYIENNRTIEKMITLARTSLLPKVKSRLRVDPDTGKLDEEDIKALETTGKKALEPMEDAGDLSGGRDCYVDPDQDLLSGAPLVVEVSAIPLSIARSIVLNIGFSNPFKS